MFDIKHYVTKVMLKSLSCLLVTLQIKLKLYGKEMSIYIFISLIFINAPMY